MGKTLYQKIYDAHVVREVSDETPILYIDRHLVHEVTSPQAFDGLRTKVALFVNLIKPLQRWITTYQHKQKILTLVVIWLGSKCKS